MPAIKKVFATYFCFTAIISILALKGFGQTTGTYAYYDSLSYQQYLAGNWKMLAETGNDAIAHGFDYYYMRCRTGIAYYYLKEYRRAAIQFEKALEFNNNEPAIIQYLYIALLEAGRKDEALKLVRQYRHTIQTLPGSSASIFRSGNLEYGVTSGKPNPVNPLLLMGSDGIYGEEDFIKNQSYFQGGISIQPSAAFSFYAGYERLFQDWQKHLAFNLAEIHRDSIVNTTYSQDYYYSFPMVQYEKKRDYKPMQAGIYLGGTWIAARGLKIVPAIHLLFENNSTPEIQYSAFTASDTAYFLFLDSSWHTFDYESGTYEIRWTQNTATRYIASLSAYKELEKWTLGINGSYGKLTKQGNQIQLGTSATWYPFGNLSLYSTLSVTGFKYRNDKRIITDVSFGKQLSPRLWIEASATLGNMALFNEKNAYVVYNINQPIRYRLGTDLIILLNPQLEFVLTGRYYARENTLYSTVKDSETGVLSLKSTADTYINYSFFGGIKWKF